jgi:hypothetical protein
MINYEFLLTLSPDTFPVDINNLGFRSLAIALCKIIIKRLNAYVQLSYIRSDNSLGKKYITQVCETIVKITIKRYE